MSDLVDPYDLGDPSDYPAAMKRDADRIAELEKRIGELEAERNEWKAEAVSRGAKLLRMRNDLININDELDDQGDLVAFGSTNHADQFRDTVEWLDAFNWDRILAESQEPDMLKRLVEANRALTAECQRREECEAALRLQLDESVSGLDAENAIHIYFSRYPSEKDK